jgi:hypothetical protein
MDEPGFEGGLGQAQTPGAFQQSQRFPLLTGLQPRARLQDHGLGQRAGHALRQPGFEAGLAGQRPGFPIGLGHQAQDRLREVLAGRRLQTRI